MKFSLSYRYLAFLCQLQFTLFAGQLAGVQGMSDWTESIALQVVRSIDKWTRCDYGTLPRTYITDHQFIPRTSLAFWNYQKHCGHLEFVASMRLLIIGEFN